MLSEDVKRCVEFVARKWGLRYVVLFGSRARGYEAPHSDYDVAVRIGRELGMVERGLLIGDFEKCFGTRVDLVVIDDWNPITAWEALAKGVLIYSDGGGSKEFYEDLAKAIDEVADLEPLIKLFRRELKHAFTRFGNESV